MSSTPILPTDTVVPSPIRAFELHFVPARHAVLEFPHDLAGDLHNEPISKPNCIRGIRSAIVIEAIAALVIYGLWQATHLLR